MQNEDQTQGRKGLKKKKDIIKCNNADKVDCTPEIDWTNDA